MTGSQKKNSILIVDDESTNIIVLTKILGPDYRIYASSEGQDAVEVAEKYVPDVILLDVLMPDMDGYEVIALLKKSEITKSIPVIFITGLDNIVSEEKGLALGAADYISKPFSSAIVKLRVQNQLMIVNHTRALDEKLRQQALMTKISHNFLTDAYIDSLFTDTLRTVGEFMDLSQLLLYKLEDDNHTMICQSEWIKPEFNIDTQIGSKFELNDKAMAVINNLFLSNDSDFCLHSNDESLMEFSRPYRKNFNIFITTPIFIKGEMRAILDFSRAGDTSGHQWNQSEINLAVLVSSIFSGVFERDAMERQFSIVEHSPNLVFYITADAVIEYTNPAVIPVTGYTKSELMAGGLGIIFGETILSEIREKHIPDAMSGQAVFFECNIVRKDNEKRTLRISVVKAGNNNFGIITTDLTEIRGLESGLIAAKELAEHSSRVKSEFLSRMSHEMLTPMNAITGMLQIIKMNGVPEPVKNYFNEIDTASRQLLGIINSVLNVSGMEYGIFKLSNSVFDFSKMARNVLQETCYNTEEKQQSLNYKIDSNIPASLIGDENRLREVITVILANAIKFTPEKGKINFEARVLPDSASGENSNFLMLQIEVTDNGIGISEEQQDKLFNIFEQVDGGLTRKFGGIGIGLALSKRIIEMMDGNIWVESDLGKGSKFCFTCKLEKC